MDYDRDFVDGKAATSVGSIHYKHHKGDGKTLIFLHGLGGSILSWKKLVALLPNALNVYLVDLLGHGASEAPPIDYTVKNQVWALNGLVGDQLLENFYIFGHSYGGWVAAYYATLYRVKGLILEDCVGLKEAFDEIVAAHRVDEFKNAFLRNAMEIAGNKDYVIKSALENDFGDAELDSAMLSKINAQTMIIWGKKDAILNPVMGEMFKREIKNSELHYIDDAGHTPHYTAPEEVLELLTGFISLH